MCTQIAKVTKNRITIIDGPCCMTVEDIEEVCPKISRKNGWQEYNVGGQPFGLKNIHISLDDDILARFPVEPVATLTYRGQVLHFRIVNQIRVVRSYIADLIRDPRKYSGYRNYLMALPSAFLGRHDRHKVTKRIDKILNNLSDKIGPTADKSAYDV